jgi:hypothetical protein
MLARDEQDVAETLFFNARASRALPPGKRHAQNRVVAREAAVFAVVDALVGKIKRREQPDDLAEALLRQLLRAAAQRVPAIPAAGRRNQRGEIDRQRAATN